MKKLIAVIIAFSAAWSMLVLNPDGCGAQTQATQGPMPKLGVAQIALMPFLMGQLESPNAPIAKPLSKSLTQLEIDSQDMPADADRVMTRIVKPSSSCASRSGSSRRIASPRPTGPW